jgi:hypothetical protein
VFTAGRMRQIGFPDSSFLSPEVGSGHMSEVAR